MYKGTHSYDPVKNRIYTRVEGVMQMKDADQFIIDGKEAIDQSKPGFTIIIDYTQASASAADVNERLGELRSYLASKGPKGVATVVSKSLMKAFVSQKLKNQNVDSTTFGTLEEANTYLDSL